MNRGSQAEPPYSFAKRSAASAMLLLWLGLFALTASPQLHEWLHKDAQSPNHQCLVTQIQHQHGFTLSLSVSAPAAPSIEAAPVSRVEVQIFSASDYRLSPSRAPPTVDTFAVA